MKNHSIFIALGTNLGNRGANLQAARGALGKSIILNRTSAIYETAPWGYLDQPNFLNQVVSGQIDLSPQALLVLLKRLERELGREPTFHYGPRAIDLDILFYDDLILETPELTIPHPHLAERAFVLIPLAEIAPEWQHPMFHQSIQELASQVPDKEDVWPWLDSTDGNAK